MMQLITNTNQMIYRSDKHDGLSVPYLYKTELKLQDR